MGPGGLKREGPPHTTPMAKGNGWKERQDLILAIGGNLFQGMVPSILVYHTLPVD